MMATAHEEWLERSEFYALGALDEKELKEFEAHLASGCPICEAYVRETREALLILHRSITPMTPSASVKTRLFHDIASEKVVPLPRKPRSTWRRWQVITGTLAAGIVGAVLAGTLITKRYEPRHTLYTSVINLLRDPATRDFPLYGTGPTPKAAGRFLWNESGEGHIFVTNLPAAPEGKMYAVWTIAQRSAPALCRHYPDRPNRPRRSAYQYASHGSSRGNLRSHARTCRHHSRAHRPHGSRLEADLKEVGLARNQMSSETPGENL